MKKNKLLFLVTVLVYLFLIGPLVVIMAASFSDTNYLKFPGEGFTLRWYQQVFTMSAFAKAARLSLFIALGGTAIALLFGLPAAYALNRYDFKGKDTINVDHGKVVYVKHESKNGKTGYYTVAGGCTATSQNEVNGTAFTDDLQYSCHSPCRCIGGAL